MSNRHAGSDFDDYLADQGLLEETELQATKRVLALQIQDLMANQQLTKTEMANRMNTSRSALNRLLDPANQAVTLTTLERAARALGKRIYIAIR